MFSARLQVSGRPPQGERHDADVERRPKSDADKKRRRRRRRRPTSGEELARQLLHDVSRRVVSPRPLADRAERDTVGRHREVSGLPVGSGNARL